MNKITDQMTYIVIAGGTLMERRTDELDRKSVIKDIADGQYEDLEQVFEFNPAEHTSREVTEDICREAAQSILDNASGDRLGDWAQNFVEQTLGLGAVREYELECREAAAYRREVATIGAAGWGL